jgi:hypothetical protein
MKSNGPGSHLAASRCCAAFRPGPNRQIGEALLLFRTMSTADEWNEQLRCPKCGKTGMASLSQDDDAMANVHSVPDGFEVVATPHGPDFRCTTCNVPVVP